MSNEISPETRAQVLREEVKYWNSQDLNLTIHRLAGHADELDPPRPKIEPGTLCEATRIGKHPHTVCGYWIVDDDDSGLAPRKHDTYPDIPVEGLHDIRPVRTLGPTQQTVTIPPPSEWPRGETMCEVVVTFTGCRNMLRVQRVIEIDEARRMHEEGDPP